MPEVKADVSAEAVMLDGVPSVRIEIVVPVDQMLAVLDLVVTTVLAAKGLAE